MKLLKQQAEKLAERYNTKQITFRNMLIELDKINKESDLFVYAATPLKDSNGHVKIDVYVPKKYMK